MWEKQGGGETWGEKDIGKGGNRREREMAIWKFLAIGTGHHGSSNNCRDVFWITPSFSFRHNPQMQGSRFNHY